MKKILFLFILFLFLVSCQRHAVNTAPVQQVQKQQPATTTPEPADTGTVSDNNVDDDIASVDDMGTDLGVLNDEEDINLNMSSFDDW